ncbi:uncharacterized protein B0H64DRAFT_207281 [Chaetomium fimeti]|uniref:Uncharacterized protein n=1 Tax=Chaetomium fimeti TaxID=1854472 RepID=A0AAE0LQ48_9PEZI|nr:hypothetical protein B0H64DRAFT_207281 [Chaetomium fimeti]
MIMSRQTTLLAAALLVSGVACQNTTQKPVFTYPPDGSKYTYHKMDTVMVNYTVFYDTAELYTFCEPGHEILVNRQTIPGPSDSVPILLDFASDKPCWFDLRTGPDGINNKSSASFNILDDERDTGPQTFGADTDAPTRSTPSETSRTESSSQASSPPPPEEGTGGGGGLKGGALYAVAFCSGLGGGILILGGMRAWMAWDDWRDDRRREAARAEAESRRIRFPLGGRWEDAITVPRGGVVDVLESRRDGRDGGTAEGTRGEPRDAPDVSRAV